MHLINHATGAVLADEVEVADTFWKRFRGLMFRRRFPWGKALLFKPPKPGRYRIHMFFVRFPIDLLYLDSRYTVVELRPRLKPWRTHRPKALSNYIVELPAGSISRFHIKKGHKLALE
jgi:hypothetical protein